MSKFIIEEGSFEPVLEPPDCDMPESCAECGCPFFDGADDIFVTDDGDVICTQCAWLHGLLEY